MHLKMMMTMTTMISKPNFKNAELAALNLLTQLDVHSYPIKVKKIAKSFNNLKIRKYSWFATKRNIRFWDACKYFDSDDGCCWFFCPKNEYVIFYNDRKNKYRIRWTLAHELGHYILGHNITNAKTKLMRYSLSDNQYKIYEKEADCFARTLLAAPQIVSNFEISNHIDLSTICMISHEAAANIINYVKKGKSMGVHYARKFSLAFSQFIDDINYKYYCSECKGEFKTVSAKHCSICGSEKIVKSFRKKRSENIMIYTGYDVDKNGKATICPRCGNEEIVNGEFCKICGTHIINRCTNADGNNYQEPCGITVDGNARYCPNCGCITTFFQDKLLKPWNVIIKENKEDEDSPLENEAAAAAQPTFEDPFANDDKPIDISDDDLPF
jgi:Zn-dependent peptidase ImmA (M78 family)